MSKEKEMKVNEFKAWFEGFCEGIGETPNLAQWNKIRDRITKLKGDVSYIPTQPVPRYPTYPGVLDSPLRVTCGSQAST